jgi:glucose-6-phosphate isomerase
MSGTARFNRAGVLAVDEELLAELKALAEQSPSRRFRLCLHSSTDDPAQEMIVVHCRDNYSRPHAHRSPLTYLVIEGSLRVLLFDDAGNVTRSIDLGARGGGSPFALRLEAGLWYMPVCLTPQVVFFETKWGPFRRDTTNLWAPWSPAEDDVEAIKDFRRGLGIAFDDA